MSVQTLALVLVPLVSLAFWASLAAAGRRLRALPGPAPIRAPEQPPAGLRLVRDE